MPNKQIPCVKRNALSAETLRALLSYEPETGEFTWLAPNGKRGIAGKKAGGLNNKGYVQITVCGSTYLAHRLAWLYAYGAFPSKQLDHINRDRRDNRLLNLRAVTQSENNLNRDVRLAPVGVYRNPRNGKFSAYVHINGLKKHLGVFGTWDSARSAHLSARENLSMGARG